MFYVIQWILWVHSICFTTLGICLFAPLVSVFFFERAVILWEKVSCSQLCVSHCAFEIVFHRFHLSHRRGAFCQQRESIGFNSCQISCQTAKTFPQRWQTFQSFEFVFLFFFSEHPRDCRILLSSVIEIYNTVILCASVCFVLTSCLILCTANLFVHVWLGFFVSEKSAAKNKQKTQTCLRIWEDGFVLRDPTHLKRYIQVYLCSNGITSCQMQDYKLSRLTCAMNSLHCLDEKVDMLAIIVQRNVQILTSVINT